MNAQTMGIFNFFKMKPLRAMLPLMIQQDISQQNQNAQTMGSMSTTQQSQITDIGRILEMSNLENTESERNGFAAFQRNKGTQERKNCHKATVSTRHEQVL
jgi:hypothetical protein